MKKYIFIVLIPLLAVFILTGVSCVNKNVTPVVNNSPVVGGDKDIHGCIGSAGYTWCEVKQKCLRSWEEQCDEKAADLINNEPIVNQEVQKPEEAENYIYRNDQYGFKMSLKKRYWNGYTVTNRGSGFYTVDMLDFNMPTNSQKWPRPTAFMFVISVFTPAKWQEAKNECLSGGRPEDCNGTFLAQSDKYAFAYTRAQDCPKDLDATFNEAKNTIKTFELIK